MKNYESAAVYLRGDKIIVNPISQTITGVGIGTEPFEVLDEKVSPTSLGEAVLGALEAARFDIPHPLPNEWSSFAKPLYKAARVRSWAKFVQGAIYCDVTRGVEGFSIEPSRNMGARGGFQPIPGQDELRIPASASAEEIGAAVRKALDISKAS